VARTVFLVSLSLGVIASGAVAAEFSIKSSVSETVEASDNYFLLLAPKGATEKSLNSATVDFLAQTPDTRYLLDTNYSYYKYFGPGAADTSLTWGTPASTKFTVDHTTSLSKFNVGASWSRRDAATTQLAQSGVVSARGSIDTYSVNGGVIHDLSRNDSITWTAQASKILFTDANQFSYVDLTTTAAWNHTVSATTTLNNSVSFDWLSLDNPAQSQRLFWKLLTGVDSKLSSRLSFNGHVGIGFVNAYQSSVTQTTAPAIPTGAASFQPQVGAGNSILADAALTYQLLRSTSVSLTAAQAILPLFTGQLQKSDTLGLTMTHNINEFSSLTYATQLSHIAAGTGAFASSQSSNSNFITASVNYAYKLTREWRTNLSYTYRQRKNDTGLVKSNTILFALSRDFTVLGNPGAINEAEKQRIKQRAINTVGEVFPSYIP
jgi:hypothetical protein